MLMFLVCLPLCFVLKVGSKPWIYCYNVCIAFDQQVNAWLGGDHDQTISSRAGLARRRGSTFGKLAADFIDWLFSPLEKNHCEKAIAFDALRKRSYETWTW